MNLTKIFLAIGITIVLAVFVNYTYTVIFPAPKPPSPPTISLPGENQKNEDFQQKWEDYQKLLGKYNFQAFLILTFLGILLVVLGIYLATSKKLEIIGPAMLGGGIITILHGIARSWKSLSQYLRIGLIFLVLLLLIFLAYKKLEKKQFGTLTSKGGEN